MDVIKLNDAGAEGEVLNGVKKGVWVERYLEGGEFEFEFTDPQMIYALPISQLITHKDTSEIMMVETHDLTEDYDGTATLKISGRSLDQIILENRIVTKRDHTLSEYKDGSVWLADVINWYGLGYSLNYLLAGTFGYPANSLVENVGGALAYIIRDHTTTTYETLTYAPSQEIDNFEVINSVINGVEPISGRVNTEYIYHFSKGQTLAEVAEFILKPFNYGIKISRPNSSHSTIQMVVHEGADLSNTVNFSWLSGDIKTARYFWSIKEMKNYFYITSDYKDPRWDSDKSQRIWRYFPLYPTWLSGLASRFGLLDASSEKVIFKSTDPAVGDPWDATGIDSAADVWYEFGKNEYLKYKSVEIFDAELVDNPSYKYGTDYNIGDVVKVTGRYSATKPMRVTEFAITFDEDEESRIPTLSEL
jgi:hypothetical protein